ncbi:Sir2 family protein [Candida parapsilosis]|uniref:NAD-dependent protein deacylase n=2 Tax=Candida parapsilosis TaxID=5480 RepID=G8B832_CANPC|nr:uncharacterized protein CPAR2_106520 [Candida parapsilosis]KAF6048606.1 Sir2 family protein [Candida parapsilosis]KAF6049438.1 Sir2 family protein [Candida parapsilosis]KAF6057289.1 Sir2 family protein [Candida parapsilosis]KAF6065992.1 Sir2 family protein [Candida parapsilosis]CAD1809972.1 unnamed protein product [Candida parapsilosis]
MNKQLAEFQEHLLKSKKIIALVGAGLSASSGLPVFRGSQGLWKNYNMIDLATPDAFYIDPGLVWQFYSWRRYSALRAEPNNGHIALAKLSRIPNLKYLTISQNVDGLSSRKRTGDSDETHVHDPKKLYEIHGSLFTLKCTSFMCNQVEKNNFHQPLTPALEDTEFEYLNQRKKRGRDEDQASQDNVIDPILITNNQDTFTATSASPQFSPVKTIDEKDLPRCSVCDGLMRPGVVWFGESLPLNLITGIDSFIEHGERPDLILVIGTSGTVYPANSYVERVKLKGGKVAIFNMDIEDDVAEGRVDGTWGFKGDAAELLPKALEPLIGKIERGKCDQKCTE